MSCYKAVIRFDDGLQHYGVKGMRWGIRKDVDKAYVKASNKLKKLQYRADRARANRGPGVASGVARTILGGVVALGTNVANKNFNKSVSGSLFNWAMSGSPEAKVKKGLEYAGYVAGGLMAAGGIHKIIKSASGGRAIRKAESWASSMAREFEGTKYSDLTKRSS